MTTLTSNTLKLTLATVLATLATAVFAAGIDHSTRSTRAADVQQVLAGQTDNVGHNA